MPSLENISFCSRTLLLEVSSLAISFVSWLKRKDTILQIITRCTILLNIFISLLYMFRASMCPSSMRWEGHVARMGEGKGVHRVLVGKPEGKRPWGRPRRSWEDNIKMDLQEVGGGGDWMELAQDRDRWRALVNTVMNLRVL